MLSDFCLHHIGYATQSNAKTAAVFLQMGYEASANLYDQHQHVNIMLLSKANTPMIELVEMIDEKSPVYNILQKNGVTTYHVCYEVDNIQLAITKLRKLHFALLFNPIEAIAFNNRLICYLYNKELGLIEILQK